MARREGVFMTPVFRANFIPKGPTLFEAADYKGNGKFKYGVQAIWTPEEFTDKDKVRWKTLQKALNDLSLDKFKKPMAKLPPSAYYVALRDGVEKEDMEGFGEGTVFANITSNQRPDVINLKEQHLGPDYNNADEIYSGCYCRATVTIYAWNNEGKGIGLGLCNVLKVKDGEPLFARSNATDDFDDIDEEWLEKDENEFEDVEDDVEF